MFFWGVKLGKNCYSKILFSFSELTIVFDWQTFRLNSVDTAIRGGRNVVKTENIID